MRLTFISTEVWPYYARGCLPEMSLDLFSVLAEQGHEVDVITVLYGETASQAGQFELMNLTLEVPVAWRNHQAQVYKKTLAPRFNIYFLYNHYLFGRDGLYGNSYGDFEDNAERFIFFSRAAVELLLHLGKAPDIVQAVNWSAGLIPLYLRTIYSDEALFQKTAVVFALHSLYKQGLFWHYDMPLTGLGWEFFAPEYIEFFGKINFFKAGLVSSDRILTFSPRYVQDILTPEFGYGLDGVLRTRVSQIKAIWAGLDDKSWNPATDRRIIAPYSAADMAPKADCRQDLLSVIDLPSHGNRPVVACLGHLGEESGWDILSPVLESILDFGVILVAAGKLESHYHDHILELARRRPQDVSLQLGCQEDMVHKILAGADIMLLPGRDASNPQFSMYPLRYGAVPVARDIGDSAETELERAGDGFSFTAHDSGALCDALRRALEAFAQPGLWREIMARGMRKDFSWSSRAPEYELFYQNALEKR